MTLKDHLAATGQTLNEFADSHNFARTTVRKIAYRTRQPSLHMADMIVQATNGEVTHADLIAKRVGA